MHKTTQHLNDEHMRLYEWSGAGIGITYNLPAKSKRTHPWHASYSVLAVMTSLLILNACDNKAQQTDQVAEKPQEAKPLINDQALQPAPAEAAAPVAGDVEPSGEGAQNPRP